MRPCPKPLIRIIIDDEDGELPSINISPPPINGDDDDVDDNNKHSRGGGRLGVDVDDVVRGARDALLDVRNHHHEDTASEDDDADDDDDGDGDHHHHHHGHYGDSISSSVESFLHHLDSLNPYRFCFCFTCCYVLVDMRCYIIDTDDCFVQISMVEYE